MGGLRFKSSLFFFFFSTASRHEDLSPLVTSQWKSRKKNNAEDDWIHTWTKSMGQCQLKKVCQLSMKNI